MNFLPPRIALRVALAYTLFGVLWILISDRVLAALVNDAEAITSLQTYKGWAFVLASAILIFLLLFVEQNKRQRAEEETRRHLAELEAVNRVSTVLRAAQTLPEMLPCLLEETLGVLNCEAGAAWLYDPECGELRQEAALGFFDQLSEKGLKPGEGIAGRVFASGETRLSPEFASDPYAKPGVRQEVPPGWGGACVPIRTAQEIVGVLFVSVKLPRQLTPEGLHLLTTLAEIAGNAIHRMSLYTQTERRLERISALHAIDSAILAGHDLSLDAILSICLSHVTAQLNVDAADVLLLNPYSQRLEYAASKGFRSQPQEDFALSMGEGTAGKVALERTLVSVPDLAKASGSFVRAALFQSEAFLSYFGTPLLARGKIIGVLEVFNRTRLNPDAEWFDFLDTLAGQAAIAIDNGNLFEDLQASNAQLRLAYDTTLEGWSRALELRDQETEGHSQRVADLTIRLARAIGVPESEMIHIRRGTLLHDIGKMGVPDTILLKPGPLTDQEWEIMRLHPVYAHRMLSPIGFLRPVLDIPYSHHEKWDGSGYPQGLKAKQIPLAARIFALADVWDALLSSRPYRPAWPKEKVIRYIQEQNGVQFDPEITPVFLDMVTNSHDPHDRN